MAKQAKVLSIQAIRNFQAALQAYRDVLLDTAANLRYELQSAEAWLEHQKNHYWPHRLRQCQEQLNEAVNQLNMKQVTTASQDAPACDEEKKAVVVAKQQLQRAQQGLQASRRWSRDIHEEADKFVGHLARLEQLASPDLVRAVASLDRIVRALERYTVPSPPSNPNNPS